MIPKKNRLLTKNDFVRPFKAGRIYHSTGISIKTAKNDSLVVRLGFVISNKVTKKATKRNKVRRRLRSIFGKRLDKLKTGFDIVILGRKEVLDMTFKQLEKSVDYLLEKAGLFR
ncbi:ribonuclease P protein component [Patescibacteria group bacterium]|nr:ribonuclease P protein component [Patescibacteria group bacterium]MBU1915529.1 ribonuclease P protein component [Patescibacteria group bacterium]